MNSTIEQIFEGFTVDGVKIPVSLLRYTGKEKTYITYSQTQIDTTLSGDDELINYVDYYDVDIYSKGNYLKIVESVKELMKQNGFTWEASMTSGDMYEDDTGYFHKTLCFAIERSVETNG